MEEEERTYKARLLISATNAIEAKAKIEKIRAIINKEGFFDVLIDDVSELVSALKKKTERLFQHSHVN